MTVPSRFLFVFRVSKGERKVEGARGAGGDSSGGEDAEAFRRPVASVASRYEPDTLVLVPCFVAERAADMAGFVRGIRRQGGNLLEVLRDVGLMACSSPASLQEAIMVSQRRMKEGVPCEQRRAET